MKYLPHVKDPHLPAADDISVNGLYVGNHHYDISDGLRVLRDAVGEVVGG
jgi:hypothetical protein